MKLFISTLFVVFCVGSALARPEESAAAAAAEQPTAPAAPAEQPAAPAEQPAVPADQPTTPAQQPAQPSGPGKKPAKPASIIGGLINHIKEIVGNLIKGPAHGTQTRAAESLADRKKKTLAKIDKLKAELQAQDKGLVVPASPKDKRDRVLAMKAAIQRAIQELDVMRAEVLNLK